MLPYHRKPDAPLPPVPGFEAVHRIWDPLNHRWTARIAPGELFVTPHDESISTILGRGLSICVRDPVLRIGGMNHFMLPLLGDGEDGPTTDDPQEAMRYGRSVMERLLGAVLKLGAGRDRLKAKMYGGVRTMHSSNPASESTIAFARRFLREEGIPIVTEKLGESYPRRLMYFPTSGLALVNRLPNRLVTALAKRETQYVRNLIHFRAQTQGADDHVN